MAKTSKIKNADLGTSSPHNNYFQKQLSNLSTARSFFQNYLPEPIIDLINWPKLRLASGDFVQKALQNRKGDILYETQFQKRKGFLYLHMEHQRKPDPDMIYRMLVYSVGISEQYRKQHSKQPPPIVFPLLLYQGKEKWKAALNYHKYLDVPEALKPYVPNFQYHLTDLSRFTDDQIKGELLLQVMLMAMRHIDSPHLVSYLKEVLFPLCRKALESGTGLEFLEDLLYYLFNANPHLKADEDLAQIHGMLTFENTEKVIMTIAEQLEQRGLQKGRQEGLQEGEARFASKLLQKKFGSLAEPYLDILKTLSLDELDLIGERIISESSLEKIFEGFPKRVA